MGNHRLMDKEAVSQGPSRVVRDGSTELLPVTSEGGTNGVIQEEFPTVRTRFQRTNRHLTDTTILLPPRPKPTRVNWKSKLEYLTRLYRKESYTKKVFKRICNVKNRVAALLQQRGIDQTAIVLQSNPLEVCGVIYAIIHLPSSKIYVGQTVHSSIDRLRSHWYSRQLRDFRTGRLHALMEKQELHNFVIWPLEVIDPNMYKQEGENNVFPKDGVCTRNILDQGAEDFTWKGTQFAVTTYIQFYQNQKRKQRTF